jgi:hypothetical protein
VTRLWHRSKSDTRGRRARPSAPEAEPAWPSDPGFPEFDLDERYVARPVRPLAQLATRVVLWAALGGGFVGGLFGLLRSASEDTQPIRQPTAEEEIVPGPVAGVAELVVAEWLTATSDDDQETLDALFVDSPDVGTGADTGLQVDRTTAVAGRRIEDGYWSVTVAADVTETVPPESDDEEPTVERATWYVQVAIVGDAGSRLAALTTPAVVPAPPGPTSDWMVSDRRAREPDEDDPVTTMASGFLGALLAGDGDPARYTAPGVDVATMAPSPFAEVEITGMAADDLGNGQTRVLAHVRATTRGGASRELSYELIAQPRGDRWEIAQFSGVPTLVLEAPPPTSEQGGEAPGPSSTTSTTAADDPPAEGPPVE